MTAEDLKALKDRASLLSKAMTRGLPTTAKEQFESFMHDLVDRIDLQDRAIEELRQQHKALDTRTVGLIRLGGS